ncbi:hypothetical protein ACLB2K_047728 [Fragaria x ananassa]
MGTPWPFYTWELDFVGKINPALDGCVWIITSTEFSTKWVEAIPLRKASGAAVRNFIREYIICRHGVPYKIVTDNGTPFVNREVSDMFKGYGVKHLYFVVVFDSLCGWESVGRFKGRHGWWFAISGSCLTFCCSWGAIGSSKIGFGVSRSDLKVVGCLLVVVFAAGD